MSAFDEAIARLMAAGPTPELKEVVARIDAASTPDRELDKAIADLLWPHGTPGPAHEEYGSKMYNDRDGERHWMSIPRFTDPEYHRTWMQPGEERCLARIRELAA